MSIKSFLLFFVLQSIRMNTKNINFYDKKIKKVTFTKTKSISDR